MLGRRDDPHGNAERDAVVSGWYGVVAQSLSDSDGQAVIEKPSGNPGGLYIFLKDIHKKDRKNWLKRA